MRSDNTSFGMRRGEDEPEIPPSSEVVIREPKAGWSRAFYEAVPTHYFAVRG
jgi:hypothetical protein